jgi:hypothetical protein
MKKINNPTLSKLTGLDRTKVFEVHLEALKDSYKELIDMNQKFMGIMLVVVGWFSTKNNPLEILCTWPSLAYVGTAFTITGFFISAYLFDILFKRAGKSCQELENLGFDPVLYSRYKISRPMYFSGLFGQLTLIIGIASFLITKYITSPVC